MENSTLKMDSIFLEYLTFQLPFFSCSFHPINCFILEKGNTILLKNNDDLVRIIEEIFFKSMSNAN